MHRTRSHFTHPGLIFAVTVVVTFSILLPVQAECPTPTIFQTSLLEKNQPGIEITTAEIQQILNSVSMPVFDVRFPLEFAISHIPSAINIPPENNTSADSEVRQIAALFPNPNDSNARFVLTCNGPPCGKSKRVAAALIAAGCNKDNIFRYQLGLPVWRALGNTVQTDIEGFAYIFNRDETAVFVDARAQQDFRADTVTCAVNIQPGEATAANDDGRLPLWDKGARVVVFADDAHVAKQVAAEIAKKAYWSSSYFGGTFTNCKTIRRFTSTAHAVAAMACNEG